METMKKFYITIAIIILMLGLSIGASAQTGEGVYFYDTGIVALGPNQKLRITVNGGSGNDAITVRFRQMSYTQGTCNGSVCKLVLSSLTASDSITLTTGEAAFYFILTTGDAVRAVVSSSSPNARVTVQIINTNTGEVNAVLIGLLVP